MNSPVWLNIHHVVAFHKKQLQAHGGLQGIRDKNLLESAIMGPQQIFHYKKSSIFDLSSSYVSGIIQNHPFIDGNKRTGLVAGGVFLKMNGHTLTISEIELYHGVMALAEGKITEAEFSHLLKTHSNHT